MENHKDKASIRKNQIFGSESRLRVGKVLAPYCARSSVVPFIKHASWCGFQNVIFPQT